MTPANAIQSSAGFDEVKRAVAASPAHLVVDEAGNCCGLITRSDVERVSSQGTPSLASAMRSDVATANASQTLNDIYGEAGKGLPIAVLDSSGRLIGRVDPTSVLEELGRVEALTDAFEREVYM
ncbi:MAG: CBS domain-containing protein [Acidimicrobiales bacterium]|nr:CBS domain-containing protein [Acidimicrobiales bacterium]